MNAWSDLVDVLVELCDAAKTVDVDIKCHGIASKIADFVTEEAQK